MLVNIEFELSEDSNVEIIVTDITGKKMATYKNLHIANSVLQTQINTSKFSNGTYLVTLLTPTYTESKKLIITK